MRPPALVIAILALLLAAMRPALADERELVKMPPRMQAHMRANMRDHLLAVHEIQAALSRTAAGQAENAARQLEGMRRFLGDRLDGTTPRPAQRLLEGDRARLELGGETVELMYTHTHYPGDAMIWMPRTRVAFAGDLVYFDRLLGVPPWSSVKHGRKAFQALEAPAPQRIVPGHGRVCDLAQARRESGGYYAFLADTIGAAAKDMEPMDATLAKHADEPRFRHPRNYGDLHRANMNRAFLEFEAQ